MNKAKIIIFRLSYTVLALCCIVYVFAIAYKNIYSDDSASSTKSKLEYCGHSAQMSVAEADGHKYVLAIRGDSIAIVHAASCGCSDAAH